MAKEATEQQQNEAGLVEEVPVLREDLLRVKSALLTAYYCSWSQDLGDGYRQLHNDHKPSPLTKHLQQTLARVEGYLQLEEDEDELPEE